VRLSVIDSSQLWRAMMSQTYQRASKLVWPEWRLKKEICTAWQKPHRLFDPLDILRARIVPVLELDCASYFQRSFSACTHYWCIATIYFASHVPRLNRLL
jgi:hypothetical protein